MIKPYEGFKAEKITSNRALPAGGYVAKIYSAKIENYSWGQVLVVSFDITEGEYANFFTNQYKNNQNEDKKWKGTLRLTIPDEKSTYFESNKRSFNNFIFALEDSNSGYHFDWDEGKFKGKMLGVLFRNREWEFNGKTGWTTECAGSCPVADIRSGDFKVPADKPLDNGSTQAAGTSADVLADDEDDDLPFN